MSGNHEMDMLFLTVKLFCGARNIYLVLQNKFPDTTTETAFWRLKTNDQTSQATVTKKTKNSLSPS